jgi:surface protein
LKQKKRIPNKTKIMSLDHDRILNDIKEARHAVNMDSIRKHHRDIWTLLHGDDKAEEKLNSITKPLQSFITAWRVNTTLVLPLVPGEPYDFLVKWGDGSGEEKIKLLRGWNADEKNTNTYTHVYTRADVYTVTITGAIRGFHRTSDDDEEYTSLCDESKESREQGVLVSVKQWGLVQLTSCKNMFKYSRNADLIWICNAPDLRWCTDMSGMFQNSENFNCNLSKWDVSNVTNMSYMFYGCTAFNQPIGNWDVSRVTTMSFMFANCNTFNQHIGSWDVSKVTNMSHMFVMCNTFNKYIGLWDVSNVKTMIYMFSACRSFDQPIGHWDVSTVTDMRYMFHGCHTFNQPIGGWDVAKVRAMSYMFHSCYAFNQPLWWDVSEVIYMTGMFLDCKKFNKPIGGWEVYAGHVGGMFKGCNAFDQYIGGWMFLSPDVPWYGLPVFDNQGLSIRAGLRPDVPWYGLPVFDNQGLSIRAGLRPHTQ